MIRDPFPARWFPLILLCSLLIHACTTVPDARPPIVNSASYDFDDTIDSQIIIQAVEHTFRQVLHTTPRVIEGELPSRLPSKPMGVYIQDRHFDLERLGTVSVAEVVCPDSLATIQAWVPAHPVSRGLHRYTGCIQPYAGAYRVNLVENLTAIAVTDAEAKVAPVGTEHPSNLLHELTRTLMDQVRERPSRTATDLTRPVALNSGGPLKNVKDPASMKTGGRAPLLASLPDRPFNNAPAAPLEENLIASAPLVCLTPRHGAALVRSEQGAGVVLQILDRRALVAVPEPVNAGYFLVRTSEEQAGWLSREDVRRMPCPIG